jgi:hypothetical protein
LGQAGDDTAGGRIAATMQFDTATTAALYTYNGVTVTAGVCREFAELSLYKWRYGCRFIKMNL